jgi:DinB superfamily
MSDTYAEQNTVEREHLERVTSNLSEKDLTCPLPNGWSVATKLAHLAFWDEYVLALLKKWARDGFTSISVDVDSINEAVRALSKAIPPRTTAELAQAAAEVVDAYLKSITPELRAAIEASGRTRLLNRSLHRREHLEQIEDALKLKR